MRLFISINVPKKLYPYCEKMQSYFPGIKPTKEFHLTIQFLGNYIDEDHVENIVSELSQVKFTPFEVKMGDALIYPNPYNPRGAWLECEKSEPLLHLSNFIRNAMTKIGFEPDKPFRPHITLGRYKGVPKIRPQKIIGQLHKFKIDKFYLIKSTLTSQGPVYEVMQEFS